ncbi:MAG: TonB C-terminal domain-containing protein [Cyanobacteria bacterium HKST-UBA02]|nr:TonB C-terminal domain-containing protein [Cyanobacteria bacterium HKST-UBA02]
MNRRFLNSAIALSILLAPYTVNASVAQTLEGGVSKSDSVMRLARPVSGAVQDTSDSMPPVAPPRRIARAPLASGTGLVDTSAFAPLAARVSRDNNRLGVASPAQFDTPRGFDLGAEANERELKLAWDRWHQQLSKTIYDNWSRAADEPGKATLRVTVTRNRTISIDVLRTSGSRSFDRTLIDVIQALSGNPGLTFPTGSQRQQVSFEADYMAASDVTPGYTWVKNDVETVRQRY